jgi:hypothetical protein
MYRLPRWLYACMNGRTNQTMKKGQPGLCARDDFRRSGCRHVLTDPQRFHELGIVYQFTKVRSGFQKALGVARQRMCVMIFRQEETERRVTWQASSEVCSQARPPNQNLPSPKWSEICFMKLRLWNWRTLDSLLHLTWGVGLSDDPEETTKAHHHQHGNFKIGNALSVF